MHMKLNFRRLLAMFLSIVMVAGMLPAAVFAEDGVETQSETYVAEVDGTGYESFADALANADGKTIKLLTDVSVASATVEAGKNITIDLNGCTITGADNVTDGDLAIMGTASLTITDSSNPSTGKFDGVVLNRGTLTIESGTVTSDSCSSEGIIGGTIICQPDDQGNLPKLNITGGTVSYTGEAVLGMAISASNTNGRVSELNISGGTITSKGVCVSAEATGTISGGTFTGNDLDVYDITNVMLKGGATITGGTYNTDVSAYVAEGYKQDENGNVVVAAPATPTGSNSYAYTTEDKGYVRVWGEGGGNAKESFVLKLYSGDTLIATTQLNNIGGIIDGDVYVTWHFFYPTSNDEYWTTTWEDGHPNSAAQPTKVELIIDGTVVATTDAKMSGADGVNPVVWADLGGVKKIVTGLSGEGTAEDPYLINNIDDLIWFRKDVNTYTQDGSNQYKGKYVKLMADINLDGINWEPIGKNTQGDHQNFLGTFDGGDHTISNLYINADGDHLGFFARVGSYDEGITPTVKNITFNNVDVSSNTTTGHGGSYVAGVIANAGGNSVVSGVKVTGNVYVAGYGYVGGIVGHGYPDIDNCSVVADEGSYIHCHYWCCGGIIGYAGEGGTPITDSSVSGVDIWSAYGAAAAVAGLLQDGNKLENVSASNVEITSNSDYCMGYIAGNGECSTMTNITANNVTVTAKGNPITSTDAVASVNGTIYFDLQTALDAAAAGTGNITVEILRDVNLNGVDWNPVTVSANGYPVVTVNGNNKTITGLNDMLFAGTWAGKSGLIINDLTIKDSNIVNDADDAAGTVGVGAFIGFPQASETITLINCHLVNSTVKGGHWTGGLIGYAAGYAGNDGPVFMNLTIKDCSVTGSTITGKGSAGGVIGHGSGNGWTNVVIESTTVSNNTITSTGSSNNKAGAVMGTIGAAGQPTTANGVTLTGGASVSATVSENIVTSNGTAITTIYGRQGTNTGMLYVTGGTYDNYPIEENVSYAAPAEGYVIEESADGTYGLVIAPTSKTYNVSTKAELKAALYAAQDGDTIVLAADIDYGTDHVTDNDTVSTWGITKAITLDLGGHTLTTHARNFGLALRNDGVIVTNGKLNHVGTVAAIKVWDAAEISDLEIDVTGTSSSGNTIDGIVIQENAAGVDLIQDVTIHSTDGQGVDSGIKTYNCGNATEPVIGSMENVTIDAKSVGLNISAPCGTATNCSIKGGTNGIEIWIKGTYSATLDLFSCNVEGGVFAHDEFNSNPSIVNNGTLKLTADTATTGASEDAITLTIARAEKVEGILKNVMDNAQAKVNDTYYATLASAIAAAQNGDIITLIWAEGDAPIAMNGAVYGKTVTITGTAIVDWSKGFLFVGRGGEGDGTVIFDNAKLTSASNSSSYGIHVSGREKDTDNKYDGTLIIKNSTIELDYLINRGTINVDNSTLTVKNGFGIAGRPASETESGTAATATIDIKNGSTVKVLNHNGMGVGRAATVVEGYGILNLTDSTFECASFNVDSDQGTFNVYGVSTVKINKLTGKTIRFQDGAIVKDSTVGGGVFVAGKVTFRGDNTFGMLSDFGTLRDYYGTTADMEWSVEAGASVTLTDKARYGLGYGDKVTIFGSLNDALKARDTLGESDIAVFMHGLVAQESTGWNKSSSLTVKDAYVVLGSNNSFGNKPGNYGGTYTFEFDNVVLDSSRITFYEAGSTTEFTFNKSDVKVGTFMIRDADSVFTLTDTKLVSTTTSNGNDEGNYLAGTLVLNNSSLSYAAPLVMESGSLTLGAGSSLTADSIIGTGKIIIDATGMTAGKVDAITANASGFTGTIKVINNDKLTAVIDENGNIVLVEVKTYVAQIGEEKFETVAAALDYAKEQGMTDVEITLIGETKPNTTDSFDLSYTALFNSVTFKQEDPTKTYYLYDLYTGVRTNGGKFIFDGVNITVTDQYMFQGNVELINNSKITSKAEANCFFFYADVIVNGGSSINGVIEDIRGGTLTIDGGKTDGTYAETPSLQDAIFIVNWADSNLVLQNGAYVKINAANEVGRLTVNGTLNISDSKLDSYQWIAVNAGATLTVNGNSTITTKEITGTGKIIIDAADMTAGKVDAITANASGFTGTLEVINNVKLTAEIDENGNIVLVAKEAELFDIAKTNMIMGQNLALMFAFEKSNIADADLSGYVAKVSIAYKDDRGTVNSEIVSSNWTTVTIGGVDYWCVTVSNLAAKEMDDDVTVTIYKGEEAISKAKTMSLRQYGEERLAASTDNLFKTTVVDMLNYGAEAQKYFEYNENNLANRNISAYQNLATTTVTLDKTRNIISDENNHFIASNVTFTSDIAMLFAIARESTAVSGKITFVNHKNGTVTTFVDSYEEIIANGKAAKKFVFTGMVVADIDQVISVEFYDAEGNVVISLTDSLDAYLGRVGSTSRMKALADAFGKFSTSAYAYLHK